MSVAQKSQLRDYSRINLGKDQGHVIIEMRGLKRKLKAFSDISTGKKGRQFRVWVMEELLELIGDEMKRMYRAKLGWSSNSTEWEKRKRKEKNAFTGLGKWSGQLEGIIKRGKAGYLGPGGVFLKASKRGLNSTGFSITALPKVEPLRNRNPRLYPVFFNVDHRWIPKAKTINGLAHQALSNTIKKKRGNNKWLKGFKQKGLLKGKP